MTEDKKNSLKQIIKDNSETMTKLEDEIPRSKMSKIKGKINYRISQLSNDFEHKVYEEMRFILGQRTFQDLDPEDRYKYTFFQTLLIYNELAKEIKK